MAVAVPDDLAGEGDHPAPQPDRRGFVDIIRHRVGHGSTRLGPVVGAGVLITVLVAAVVVAIGALSPRHTAAGPAVSPSPSSAPDATASPTLMPGAVTTYPAGGRAAGGRTDQPVTHAIPAPSGPSPSTPAGPAYTGIAAYGCAGAADRGIDVVGYHYDGTVAEWYHRGSGGYTAAGCSGVFVAMPMSGSATADDPTNRVVWWFHVGTAPSSCTVSVYVPSAANPNDVAGHPAYYFVYPNSAASGTALGGFTIDQTAHRGSWVKAGTFAVTTGYLAVKLASRGVDFTSSGPDYHHLGASAAEVSCTR
jgi:hypothetical protein